MSDEAADEARRVVSWRWWGAGAAALLVFSLSGCSGGEGSSCSSSADCDGELECRSGQCAAPSSRNNLQPEPDMSSVEDMSTAPQPDQSGPSENNNNAPQCSGAQVACGSACCPEGFTCEQGSCSCPQERFCQGICCAEGQSCELGQCVDPCDGERCGASLELCCVGEQVCINGGCADPGVACEFNEQCPAGQVCEPLVGSCVPAPEQVCEYRPPVGEFTPMVGCEWRSNELPQPDRGDVVAAPIVLDVADEGEEPGFETPEIIFPSFHLQQDGCCRAPGTLRIVSGQCDGEQVRTIASLELTELLEEAEPSWAITHDVGLAGGDLTGDGVPEIVATVRKTRERADGTLEPYQEGTVAFTRSRADGTLWEVLWYNPEYPRDRDHVRAGGLTISLADMEGDGQAEVIIGSLVLGGIDGTLRWDGTAETQEGEKRVGQGHNLFGPVSSVVDVDQDGLMEVFAGNTLYGHDGQVRWRFEYDSENSFCTRSNPNLGMTCDGYNGVVDFDGDGRPELVSVRLGEIWVIDAETARLDAKFRVPHEDCFDDNGRVRNESGPPTVADFDGDGRAEIGTAGADFYVVADGDCDVDDWEARGCHSRGILWATPNEDCSSRSTASSVFDFEGDGAAEVVYADERTFRILSGKTGEVLFEDADHRSNTRIELPVIADTDADENAEVIVGSAWYDRFPEDAGPEGKPGLRIWQDAEDNWVRTRRVWNQHSYHVTNVNADGTIPAAEPPNWAIEGLNNYRQNVQPSGLFNAPDLVVRELRTSAVRCSQTGQLEVYVLLGNDGALGVPAGVSYRVEAILEGSEPVVLGEGVTNERLLPGQTLSLSFSWATPVDFQVQPFTLRATIDGAQEHQECDEDNNSASLDEVTCQVEG